MAFPTCPKCGQTGFRTHDVEAMPILKTPAYQIVMCAKPTCDGIIGTLPDPKQYADISYKLGRIMQALKIT